MGSSISDVSTRRKEGTGWPMIVSCQDATYKSARNIFLSGASTTSSHLFPFISHAGDNNCNAKKFVHFYSSEKAQQCCTLIKSSMPVLKNYD